jgi:hypothetical protein|tara:strand:- start:790 stop:1164 length:375 start_codon:yes stop_codon:yes gene_type:complete
MTFDIKMAVFPQTSEDHKRMMKDRYDANKKYPEYGGVINVARGDIPALVKYLTHATPDYDDYLNEEVVPLRVSGYMNTSKQGKKYLGLKISPDYKKQQDVENGTGISANTKVSESSGGGDFAFD